MPVEKEKGEGKDKIEFCKIKKKTNKNKTTKKTVFSEPTKCFQGNYFTLYANMTHGKRLS